VFRRRNSAALFKAPKAASQLNKHDPTKTENEEQKEKKETRDHTQNFSAFPEQRT
jgi:hypothetical protein